MVAAKRAHQGTGQIGNKRVKTDPILSKIDLVKDALMNPVYETPQYPMSVREMLVAGALDILRARKETRFPFQVRMTENITEVVGAIKETLDGTLSDKNQKAEGANTEKTRLEAARDGLKEELAAKKEEIQKLNGLEDLAREAFSAAVEAEKQAVQELEEAKASMEAEVEVQATNQKVFTENFTVLRDTPPETPKELKKLLNLLIPHLKKMNAPESLLTSMPTSFSKKPEDRQDFDKMVVTNIQALFEKSEALAPETLAGLEQKIAEKEAERVAKIQECSPKEVEVLRAEELASKALDEKKELEKKIREATKQVSDFAKSTKDVFGAVNSAEEQLQTFSEVTDALEFLNSDRKEKKDHEQKDADALEAEEEGDDAAMDQE